MLCCNQEMRRITGKVTKLLGCEIIVSLYQCDVCKKVTVDGK